MGTAGGMGTGVTGLVLGTTGGVSLTAAEAGGEVLTGVALALGFSLGMEGSRSLTSLETEIVPVLLLMDEEERLEDEDFEGEITLAIALNGDKTSLTIESKNAIISNRV